MIALVHLHTALAIGIGWLLLAALTAPAIGRWIRGPRPDKPDVSYTRSKAPPPDPDSPLETERRRLIQRTERAMTRYEEAQRRRVA